ncbi:nesprin-4 isoform 3 [Bos taurus]|uniref:nesprin-4 isoform 3 n=1 Tax=Bos taurus TaxID=9913 RepID=UPI0038B63BEF
MSAQSRMVQLQDMLMSGLSHRQHVASHRRQPLLWKSRDRMRQASPSLQDVMLEADPGVPTPASRRPLTFFHLLLLLLFLFLVGITLFLPTSGGSCCSPAQLIGIPYLELSYVNGTPPM